MHLHVAVLRALNQHHHGGQIAHAVGPYPGAGPGWKLGLHRCPKCTRAGTATCSYNHSCRSVGASWQWSRYCNGGRYAYGHRSNQVRSACGSSLVAPSTRTWMEVIQWVGVTTTLITDFGDTRCTPRVFACIASPHFPPFWYVQRVLVHFRWGVGSSPDLGWPRGLIQSHIAARSIAIIMCEAGVIRRWGQH